MIYIPDLKRILETAGEWRLTIEELPALLAGDQIFVRRNLVGPAHEWLVAYLIRVATFTATDAGPTIYNHVATVVRPIWLSEAILIADGELAPEAVPPKELASEGPITDYLIAEALGKGGFQYRPLLGSYGDARRYSIGIARHRFVGPEERGKILAACAHLKGKTYGYLKIAAHIADFALTRAWNALGGRGDVFVFRWLCRMERYPMCSWSSLYEYDKADRPFETPIATGSPDDLADECQRKAGTVWDWPFVSAAIRELVETRRRRLAEGRDG